MSTAPKHDLGEARSLIGVAAAKSTNHHVVSMLAHMKAEAQGRLFEDLLQLHETAYVFRVGRGERPTTLAFMFEGVEVRLFYNADPGRFVVRWANGSEMDRVDDLRITFDPIGQQFVGLDEDAHCLPEPGHPRRKRSAVAVIVEAILGLAAKHPAVE